MTRHGRGNSIPATVSGAVYMFIIGLVLGAIRNIFGN